MCTPFCTSVKLLSARCAKPTSSIHVLFESDVCHGRNMLAAVVGSLYYSGYEFEKTLDIFVNLTISFGVSMLAMILCF